MSATEAQRTKDVTMKGNALTRVGELPAVGQTAPAFTLLTNDLSETSLSDFKGNTVLVSVVPSLDTGVCDQQTRRFNEEAASLGDTEVLTVSMDLPFAQARWCGAAGVDKVTTLSAHRSEDFGLAYGVLLEELRLLGRAVFVVGKDGTLKHVQLVNELTEHPDYDEALEAVRADQ